MRDGTKRAANSRKSEKLAAGARTEIGSVAHADWTEGGSRISRAGRWTEGGVERRFARWFWLTYGSAAAERLGQQLSGLKEKPQPNGKERLGFGNRALQSGKCDKRTTKTIYGDSLLD